MAVGVPRGEVIPADTTHMDRYVSNDQEGFTGFIAKTVMVHGVKNILSVNPATKPE